ncbi:nucleotidyltransferase family protein [Campylobacter mucosalis]|uniref:nucleotidyltransferase family protein n=1 Tax=Campylobacter mucosalis TaxID=202 RepID=UPI0004D8BF4D|nr:nucleotidyltransferase domain-containing protein [Campylobacter mucosalis]KEA45838.1 nucleotidyltransferase [Campylobacter mucosalis]QKF62367.1 nucleotidyltransferase domain-containing protein [Campylobacter mucosalis]
MATKIEILEYLSSIKDELFSNGITKLGLFGSYAKDKANAFSDIDIVVESNAKEMVKKLGNPFLAICYFDDIKSKISNKFHLSVDLCDTTSMPLDKKNNLTQGAIYV